MSDEKRKEARRRADRLRTKFKGEDQPLNWFEALYKEANGDPELIPWGGSNNQQQDAKKTDSKNQDQWAHGQARLPLVNWLQSSTIKTWIKESPQKPRALDVGCGLGHNAMALSNAGFDVTAFDISETAVKWAAKHYASLPIQWTAQNLLDLPKNWEGYFDLVSETFTIQALYGVDRENAFKALAKLVAKKGRLLIVCRGRKDDVIPDTPPLPLSSSELDQFETLGLRSVSREKYEDNRTPPNLHFIAEFVRD